jgi:RNA polymerase sigma factor (sigma-70 family)
VQRRTHASVFINAAVVTPPASMLTRQVTMPYLEADLDLLKRYAVSGDPDAFAQIVHRYTALVYHTCLRVLHDRALAEEVSQDTFYRLMCKPGTVNRSVGAWLHRTATHRSLDVLRSDTARKRREREYSNDYYHGRANPPSWSILSPQIDQALAKLPEPNRSLLIEHFLLGKPQRQLAKETHTSPATVSRRIKQGLQDLRKHLGGAGLVVTTASITSMLMSQTSLAAPATVAAELGKMAMVSGSPMALGTGGVSVGAITVKTSTALVGAVGIGLALYALIHFGNGQPTLIPNTEGPSTRAAILNQATQNSISTGSEQGEGGSSGRVYNPNAMYLIPHPDPNFDTRIILTFQSPPADPDATVSVGFADGHAKTITVRKANEIIQKQTEKSMRELMEILPPITMQR